MKQYKTRKLYYTKWVPLKLRTEFSGLLTFKPHTAWATGGKEYQGMALFLYGKYKPKQ
jgi:hypothetical protein